MTRDQSTCTLSYEKQNYHMFVHKNIQTEKKGKIQKCMLQSCI